MKTEREQMIDTIRSRYGLNSPDVFAAMLQIPREKFVGKHFKSLAYRDRPVSIGYGQTMSQPYTVAFMTHLVLGKSLKVKGENRSEKVLEIGTGSGYQAAILSRLFKEVYTVEIVPELAAKAKKNMQKLGFENVHVISGSGEWGWEEASPYDAIIITAGVEKIPDELFDQLIVTGVMVVPVGHGQDKIMTRITKSRTYQTLEQARREEFGKFVFVPFVKEKN